MSQKKKKVLEIILKTALSLLIVCSGALLIASCVGIYRLGSEPYSTESIRSAFSRIAPLIYVTLVSVALAILARIFFPEGEKKQKATIAPEMTLKRLEKRFNANACPPDAAKSLSGFRKARLAAFISSIALSAVSIIPALLFSLNANNFSMEDSNASIISACMLILPAFLASFGIWVAYSYINGYFVKKQIAIVKDCIKNQQSAPTNAPADGESGKKCPCKKKKLMRTLARVIILAIAVGMIIAGILNGGMVDVLEKAVNICTECIGLG